MASSITVGLLVIINRYVFLVFRDSLFHFLVRRLSLAEGELVEEVVNFICARRNRAAADLFGFTTLFSRRALNWVLVYRGAKAAPIS